MENYTVERVLLGLQKAYLENYQKINKLKEYCIVKDKKIIDYHFAPVFIKRTDYKCFILYFDKDYSKLTLLLDKIKKMLNFCRRFDSITIGFVDGEYKNCSPSFPIQTKEENTLDFSEYAKLIINSDFTKYINSEEIKLEDGDKDNHYKLDIFPSQIALYQMYTLLMLYSPYYNRISFKNNHGILDNAYIERLLSMEIPASSLNPYELEVIAKSGTENQKIIITEEIKENKKVCFNICNHNEGLILTRTK